MESTHRPLCRTRCKPGRRAQRGRLGRFRGVVRSKGEFVEDSSTSYLTESGTPRYTVWQLTSDGAFGDCTSACHVRFRHKTFLTSATPRSVSGLKKAASRAFHAGFQRLARNGAEREEGEGIDLYLAESRLQLLAKRPPRCC